MTIDYTGIEAAAGKARGNIDGTDRLGIPIFCRLVPPEASHPAACGTGCCSLYRILDAVLHGIFAVRMDKRVS